MSHLLSNLVGEHEKIQGVLAALQNFTAFHANQIEEPRESLACFVLFFRDYLDRWHHSKEEKLLFPAMVEAGLPGEVGPVACMLHDHDQGRNLLNAMAALAEANGTFTPSEIGLLGELAVGYAQILTLHIAKENRMLYPMAQRVLSAEQMSALDALGAKIDESWGQDGLALQELGAALCARFGGREENASIRPPAQPRPPSAPPLREDGKSASR